MSKTGNNNLVLYYGCFLTMVTLVNIIHLSTLDGVYAAAAQRSSAKNVRIASRGDGEDEDDLPPTFMPFRNPPPRRRRRKGGGRMKKKNGDNNVGNWLWSGSRNKEEPVRKDKIRYIAPTTTPSEPEWTTAAPNTDVPEETTTSSPQPQPRQSEQQPLFPPAPPPDDVSAIIVIPFRRSIQSFETEEEYVLTDPATNREWTFTDRAKSRFPTMFPSPPAYSNGLFPAALKRLPPGSSQLPWSVRKTSWGNSPSDQRATALSGYQPMPNTDRRSPLTYPSPKPNSILDIIGEGPPPSPASLIEEGTTLGEATDTEFSGPRPRTAAAASTTSLFGSRNRLRSPLPMESSSLFQFTNRNNRFVSSELSGPSSSPLYMMNRLMMRRPPTGSQTGPISSSSLLYSPTHFHSSPSSYSYNSPSSSSGIPSMAYPASNHHFYSNRRFGFMFT